MKYDIILDFDGTVVEHEYPKIGTPNPGAVDVIKKLIDAGCEITINTYRVNISRASLKEAFNYLNEALELSEDKQLKECYIEKVKPPIWSWHNFKREGKIFIDDIAEGIPLRKGSTLPHVNMVDWVKLDEQFRKNRIYE